jgi:hypothetical protein
MPRIRMVRIGRAASTRGFGKRPKDQGHLVATWGRGLPLRAHPHTGRQTGQYEVSISTGGGLLARRPKRTLPTQSLRQ